MPQHSSNLTAMPTLYSIRVRGTDNLYVVDTSVFR
jgi:hypothetical protein